MAAAAPIEASEAAVSELSSEAEAEMPCRIAGEGGQGVSEAMAEQARGVGSCSGGSDVVGACGQPQGQSEHASGSSAQDEATEAQTSVLVDGLGLMNKLNACHCQVPNGVEHDSQVQCSDVLHTVDESSPPPVSHQVRLPLSAWGREQSILLYPAHSFRGFALSSVCGLVLGLWGPSVMEFDECLCVVECVFLC